MAQDKPQLIYFGDPMCSWCYGFSPEISKTLDTLDNSIDFQLIMGGLRPYNKETMKDLGDFLKKHWQQVNERSGQPFSYEILKDTSFVYDTEPSCRAVIVMKHLKPDAAFDFFKKIQHSFYAENKNTNLTETYSELAETFGIKKDVFQKAFESDEMKKAVRDEFVTSQEIGVRGFPTIILQKNDQMYLISNGYATADALIEKCRKILNQ